MIICNLCRIAVIMCGGDDDDNVGHDAHLACNIASCAFCRYDIAFLLCESAHHHYPFHRVWAVEHSEGSHGNGDHLSCSSNRIGCFVDSLDTLAGNE